MKRVGWVVGLLVAGVALAFIVSNAVGIGLLIGLAVAVTLLALNFPILGVRLFVPLICVYYFADSLLRYRLGMSDNVLSLVSRWQIVVLLAAGVRAYQQGARLSLDRLDMTMLAFLVWTLLYVPTAPSAVAAAYGASNLLQFEVAYWTGRFAASNLDGIPKLLIAVALPLAVFGLIEPPLLGAAFYETVAGHVPDGYLQNTGSGFPRSSSLVGSPGYFGSLLMVVIPLALSRALQGNGTSDRFSPIRRTGVVILLSLALVASFHRSSWAGAAVACVLVVGCCSRSPQWGLVGAGVAAAAVFVSGQVFGLGTVVDNAVSLRDFSAASHVDRAQDYLYTALTTPWGSGLGTAGNTAAFLGDAAASGVDGGYSQVVLQLGWVGLGLFVALHLMAMGLLLKRTIARSGGERSWAQPGAAGAIAAVMVFDLALPFQSFNPALMLLWLVVGWAVSPPAGWSREGSEREWGARAPDRPILSLPR